MAESKSQLGISVTGVTFSDGSTLSFARGDIVIFVGPNNSGKSVALAEIYEALAENPNPLPRAKVVTKIDLDRLGTTDEIISHLERLSQITNESATDRRFDGVGYNISQSWVKAWWQGGHLKGIRNAFSVRLTTTERLQASNPPDNINLLEESGKHPIHRMQRDDTAEARISGFFRQAFGSDLIVHRNAGNSVPLYCGVRPVVEENEDRTSFSYIKKVEALDPVALQGDGIKSFVGVILYTLLAPRDVTIVDEPEAFLHPPQARILGRMLAAELSGTTQLFCATHSGDFLRGLLDRDKGNVHVVRVQRSEKTNPVRLLDKSAVKHLWRDPLLRYSNILDAVFHKGVVICESDSDCRFYAAIMDTPRQGETLEQDLMFTHCGGLHRIPMVIKALSALDVPFAAVVDFDALRDETVVRTLFESCHGDWSLIDKDWKIATDAINTKNPELSAENVIKGISAELNTVRGSVFPEKATDAIKKILRQGSPWSLAKSMGKAYLPPGNATQACNRLLTHLNQAGLFVVTVGELESFDKTVPGHGPTWVNGVLQKDLTNDPELNEARTFTAKVIAFASGRQ